VSQAVTTRAQRRFIGGVSAKPDSKGAIRQAIASNLQLIARCNEEIDRLCRERDIAFGAAEGLMKSAGFTHEEAHGYALLYEEQFTRASRTVRTKDFRDKVGDEKFMEVAKVNVGDAEKFLGEKEMAEVVDSTAAKSAGFAVVLKQIKTEVIRKPKAPKFYNED
jgi:hypothetical protein